MLSLVLLVFIGFASSQNMDFKYYKETNDCTGEFTKLTKWWCNSAKTFGGEYDAYWAWCQTFETEGSLTFYFGNSSREAYCSDEWFKMKKLKVAEGVCTSLEDLGDEYEGSISYLSCWSSP